MTVTKKPLKTGGIFLTDADGKVLKFTAKQAMTQIRRFKKDAERRLTNNFKYKHLELIEKESYFCYPMA